MSIHSAGGSFVNPIEQEHGAPITIPANPTKEGYVFKTWNPNLPKVMPKHEMTVIAVWDMIVNIPAPVNGLCYTGEYQTNVPIDEGYVTSGECEMKDAGEYVSYLTLKEGCVWDDGTYEIKELFWKIDPKKIYVYPKKDMYKCYFDGDADLEYHLSEDVTVLGKLDRDSGEKPGNYKINIGSLTPADDNYCLVMDEETVYFTIIVACPGVPTGLYVISDDNKCCKLQWNVPDFDGGCEVSCYEVWIKSDKDNEWILYDTVKSQECCDVLLEHDVSYNFAVKAVNLTYASGYPESMFVEIKITN